MNNFDIKRFGKTLRWVVSVNFRKMLLWFTGSVLAVFLGELLTQFLNGHSAPYYAISNFSAFMALILTLVSMIMVSSVVSSINEKRKREAFLMLPATNLEKYLALVVYSTVICITVAILAIVLGDSLRMGWYWVIGYSGPEHATIITTEFGETYYWWSSTIPMLIENLTPHLLSRSEVVPADLMIVEMSFIIGGILWLHSIYTLGGTLLRKYSFVATTIFWIFCGTILVRIILALDMTMFHSRWDNGELLEYEIGTISWILAILFPILSVLNYWASFRIFKGFQLITNKWLNYDFHK